MARALRRLNLEFSFPFDIHLSCHPILLQNTSHTPGTHLQLRIQPRHALSLLSVQGTLSVASRTAASATANHSFGLRYTLLPFTRWEHQPSEIFSYQRMARVIWKNLSAEYRGVQPANNLATITIFVSRAQRKGIWFQNVVSEYSPNPSPRGERRNRLRRRIGRKPKYYPRKIGLDIIKPSCTNEDCTHPSHNQLRHHRIAHPRFWMASGADIRAALGAEFTPGPSQQAGSRPSQHAQQTSSRHRPSAPIIKPRRFKKPPLRSRVRSAHWTYEPLPTASHQDKLPLRRWNREAPPLPDSQSSERFAKYNVVPDVPTYTPELYEKDLVDPSWTKDETDYLMETYRECSGKWPVIIDRYESERPRSMEDLKARFYFISSRILSHQTPISSMTGPEYDLYETLKSFDPHKEGSRKKLAEGHLTNYATPVNPRRGAGGSTSPPSSSTSRQQWISLLQADKARRVQRLRSTDTQPRPNQPQASAPPPPAPAETETSTDLSKADLTRFGVVQANEKLPSGISFASDRLSKPRVAKSQIQTEKISTLLQHIGVPELIPLPTVPVIEQFETIMSKVHTLLDMRKLAEKEEQELRVRQAETGHLILSFLPSTAVSNAMNNPIVQFRSVAPIDGPSAHLPVSAATSGAMSHGNHHRESGGSSQ
ncbi:hypothetical protein KC347_g75 [Hortaea werneckii]|nr:hypothetical protein KC347_g75 [Hortaea werneckii]